MARLPHGERTALIATPRTALFAKLAVLALGALGVSVVFAAHSPTAQPQLTRAQSRSVVELLDQGPGSVLLNVEFALCDTGFCTKNGDGLTASCGCLSMRPTEKNRGSLNLGWPGAVLGDSAVFLAALASTDGDLAIASMLETAITDRTLFDGYYDEAPTRVSLYADSNEYFSTPSSAVGCTNVSVAQCMGAPCFDRVYEGIWNLTCICPYVASAASTSLRTHGGLCEDASDTGCAVVGGGVVTYAEQALESILTAVKQAQVTIRRDECAAYITTDDEEGTRAIPA